MAAHTGRPSVWTLCRNPSISYDDSARHAYKLDRPGRCSLSLVIAPPRCSATVGLPREFITASQEGHSLLQSRGYFGVVNHGRTLSSLFLSPAGPLYSTPRHYWRL